MSVSSSQVHMGESTTKEPRDTLHSSDLYHRMDRAFSDRVSCGCSREFLPIMIPYSGESNFGRSRRVTASQKTSFLVVGVELALFDRNERNEEHVDSWPVRTLRRSREWRRRGWVVERKQVGRRRCRCSCQSCIPEQWHTYVVHRLCQCCCCQCHRG
ncbi:hypothetical protein BO71DRAFT_146063 [Aspergillus ellipticus CBS 707.79]|uniref:Uncharacterized protein n=1 Tax=Aspergillus ellipticus CBS 707.79 TaxID=1448320 RepID=A0A319DI44_9EURO|nr:hypothetical protein BO71DRAFT_146063 [Aspergillus ellipticus CBS 707.79]